MAVRPNSDAANEVESAVESPNKKPKAAGETGSRVATNSDNIPNTSIPPPNESQPEQPTEPIPTEQDAPPVSDADWLRGKTSRLLGLIDDDEDLDDARDDGPVHPAVSPPRARSAPSDKDSGEQEGPNKNQDRDSSNVNDKETSDGDANIQLLRNTGRLFVRNLPYNCTEKDLQSVFSPFGKIEEVCTI